MAYDATPCAVLRERMEQSTLGASCRRSSAALGRSVGSYAMRYHARYHPTDFPYQMSADLWYGGTETRY
eukprot:3462467-Rhodomonas_salina.6